MFPTAISATAPIKAENSVQSVPAPMAMLKIRKMNPPTNEPTSPSIIFKMSPKPEPFITLPAKYPAKAPMRM